MPERQLGETECWTGVLTRVRPISRRLIFGDMVPGSRPAGSDVHLEIKIFCADLSCAESRLARSIRVGDTVRCVGPVEAQSDRMGALLLHSQTWEVVARGDGAAPDVPSTTLPLPPEGSDARARRDARLVDRRAHQKACLQEEVAAIRAVLDDDAGHGDRASKYHRAVIYARWLMEGPLGPALAKARDGDGIVLDVAGGRGGLAFALAAHHGVRCATVDPRDFRLDKRQHRWLRRRGRPREGAGADADSGSDDGPQMDFDAVCSADSDDESAAPAAAETEQEGSLLSPLGAELPILHYIKDYFDAEEDGFRARHSDVMPRVCCLIGLHPDQATEPIVDCALRIGVPFAVVPCCVFPKLFPHRRLKERPEEEVSTYTLFVQYLREKSDRTRIAELPMDGRAIVVFG